MDDLSWWTGGRPATGTIAEARQLSSTGPGSSNGHDSSLYVSHDYVGDSSNSAVSDTQSMNTRRRVIEAMNEERRRVLEVMKDEARQRAAIAKYADVDLDPIGAMQGGPDLASRGMMRPGGRSARRDTQIRASRGMMRPGGRSARLDPQIREQVALMRRQTQKPLLSASEAITVPSAAQSRPRYAQGPFGEISNRDVYVCAACPPATSGNEKFWTRLDNFKRNHLMRKHPEGGEEAWKKLIEESKRDSVTRQQQNTQQMLPREGFEAPSLFDMWNIAFESDRYPDTALDSSISDALNPLDFDATLQATNDPRQSPPFDFNDSRAVHVSKGANVHKAHAVKAVKQYQGGRTAEARLTPQPIRRRVHTTISRDATGTFSSIEESRLRRVLSSRKSASRPHIKTSLGKELDA